MSLPLETDRFAETCPENESQCRFDHDSCGHHPGPPTREWAVRASERILVRTMRDLGIIPSNLPARATDSRLKGSDTALESLDRERLLRYHLDGVDGREFAHMPADLRIDAGPCRTRKWTG
jgi:hypothetical protein